MDKDKSGPAYPVVAANGLGHVADGLTRREWFAGEALIGILQLHGYVTGGAGKAAQMAVEVADALLKELEKNG